MTHRPCRREPHASCNCQPLSVRRPTGAGRQVAERRALAGATSVLAASCQWRAYVRPHLRPRGLRVPAVFWRRRSADADNLASSARAPAECPPRTTRVSAKRRRWATRLVISAAISSGETAWEAGAEYSPDPPESDVAVEPCTPEGRSLGSEFLTFSLRVKATFINRSYSASSPLMMSSTLTPNSLASAMRLLILRSV